MKDLLERLFYFSNLFLLKEEVSYKRFLFTEIDNSKAISIIGAKGVGKTTLLHQYMKSLMLKSHELLYVSVDNPLMSSTTILDIADAFQKMGGKVLVLDEIHYQKDFEKDLKTIYDFFDLQVIFSGSSAIALNQAKVDLSRRVLNYKMPILSFREFLEMQGILESSAFTLEELLENHVEIASKIVSKIKPLAYFGDYLKHGAYPFFLEGEEKFALRLTQAINKTIESDITQLYNIDPSNVSVLKKLLVMLCASNPYELNISELAAAAEINKKTLYNYMYALDSAEILNVVGAKSRGSSIISKPQKIYLGNPNLFGVLCVNSHIGTIRESFISSMVKYNHEIEYPNKGDFVIDSKHILEVGGKSKGFKQIKDMPDSYVVADDIEIGFGNKIPLWLFGFLY